MSVKPRSWIWLRGLAEWAGLRGPVPLVQRASDSPRDQLDSLREAYAAQTEQLARLQRQAALDTVSGLPSRPHFVLKLSQRLAQTDAPSVALLLVRVLRLDALNERLGFQATDRLLGAVGDVLMTYVDRVPHTFCGRLNGSDFALCLPVAGLAEETAASLRAALGAAPSLRASGAEVAVGGADEVRDTSAGQALATADASLARAEAGMEAGAVLALVAPGVAGDAGGVGAGARAWREQIGAALAEGRIELHESPSYDRRGVEQRLSCRLHLQLARSGAFEPPERWQPLARRSRLVAPADLAAVALALSAIARDGRSRAVPLSSSSLMAPGFVGDVAAQLAGEPAAAQRLVLQPSEDLPSAAAAAGLLAAMSAVWRPAGVQLAVRLPLTEANRLHGLRAAGIALLRLDVRPATADAAMHAQLRACVDAARRLGLQVQADGVDDASALAAVWALGFDAASGDALTALPPRP